LRAAQSSIMYTRRRRVTCRRPPAGPALGGIMRRPRPRFAALAVTMAALALTNSGLFRVAGAQVAPSTIPFVALNARVYVANEGTSAISVLKPTVDASGTSYSSPIVATVCLGSDTADDVAGTPSGAFRDAPCDGNADHHKPFYDGHVGTHGLW